MFLEANDIPQERRVPVFLSVIGATNFALITTLVAPKKPSDKSVNELLWTLRTHFTQKRVTIAERFKFYNFYNRSQGESESAAQYAGELRRLAVHCNFPGTGSPRSVCLWAKEHHHSAKVVIWRGQG